MDPSDLQVLIEDAGVSVVRLGKDEIYAHCPMPKRHPNGDRRASWSINTDTGVHFCFSCGYRGTLRQLLTDLTGEVPRDIELEITKSSVRRHLTNARRKDSAPEPEPEQEIFVSEYWLQTYTDVPVWACNERMLDPDLVDYYGVRWDAENEFWIIPVRDFDGKLLGWQEKGKGHFKNVPTGMQKSKSLFGLDRFAGMRAVLVESPLDIIRLASVGVDDGLASYGSHVSADQVSALIENASVTYLALDHDEAGRSSMVKLIDQMRHRTKVKIVRYRKTDPKDVGEMTEWDIHRLLDRAVTPGLERVHR